MDENKHQSGCIYCDYEETAAHTWDGGSTTLAPTCQATGEALFTCTGCGETRSEVVPMNGIHTYDHGFDTGCDACGFTRVTQHLWSGEWSHGEGGHFHACTSCGERKDEAAHDFRRGVCTVCTAADPNYELAPVGLIAAAAVVVCGGAAGAVAVRKKKKKNAA